VVTRTCDVRVVIVTRRQKVQLLHDDETDIHALAAGCGS